MKTGELTGKALAYAVGIAEGYKVEYWHSKSVAVRSTGIPRAIPWNPHTDWSQGGPIIEREGIALGNFNHAKSWVAYSQQAIDTGINGPTPLIAAMRCYVASTLGDTVDIPEELR